LPNQIAARIGATPSVKAGTTTRRVKATASFGRLISANRLPASDSSERRLELDASSSISPRRGSMAGLKQLLPRMCDGAGTFAEGRRSGPPRTRASRGDRSSVERAAPAGAEPAPEAIADERRVAHRLPDPGLVVDLRRQQDGPAVIEAPRHQLLEVALVAHPLAVADAGTARRHPATVMRRKASRSLDP